MRSVQFTVFNLSTEITAVMQEIDLTPKNKQKITVKNVKQHRAERIRDRWTCYYHWKHMVHSSLQEPPHYGYCWVLITALFFCHPGLEGSASLWVLQLSFNRISSLRPGDLSHLRQLKELHLQHNLITNLHPQMFQDLAQLRVSGFLLFRSSYIKLSSLFSCSLFFLFLHNRTYWKMHTV